MVIVVSDDRHEIDRVHSLSGVSITVLSAMKCHEARSFIFMVQCDVHVTHHTKEYPTESRGELACEGPFKLGADHNP